jgi:hypothetical protein
MPPKTRILFHPKLKTGRVFRVPRVTAVDTAAALDFLRANHRAVIGHHKFRRLDPDVAHPPSVSMVPRIG